jgi:hypothetical protein
LPKLPQQIKSLAVIFALAIAAFIAAKIIFTPKTFGKYGHYRASAVDEVASLPIIYAGSQACAECHDDVAALKAGSNHRGLTCEVCHDAAAKHAEAPEELIPPAPRERGQCPLCHGYDPSRPTGFPQIQTALHNPGKPCMSCHNPHNPMTPRAPEDCSACHRGIASEKGVSPHAALACTTCHTAPAEHLLNPRVALAEKPTSRAFCATCHAVGAESSSEIPRIESATHGERYLCWDCHYPHHPEAN